MHDEVITLIIERINKCAQDCVKIFYIVIWPNILSIITELLKFALNFVIIVVVVVTSRKPPIFIRYRISV